MSFDGMRGYLQLVTGLGDATRAKATEVAQGLLAMATRPNPAEMAQQVTHLAEEVLAAAQSNRDALVSMIRKEVEDLVESSTSLAKRSDLDAVKAMVMSLSSELIPGRGEFAAHTDPVAELPPRARVQPVPPRARRRGCAGVNSAAPRPMTARAAISCALV